jgi:hypothetical protein
MCAKDQRYEASVCPSGAKPCVVQSDADRQSDEILIVAIRHQASGHV